MSSCMSIVTFENCLRNLKQPYSNALISQMRNIILNKKGLPCRFSLESEQDETGKSFGYRSISNLLIELGFYDKTLQQKQFCLNISYYCPNNYISYNIIISKAHTGG